MPTSNRPRRVSLARQRKMREGFRARFAAIPAPPEAGEPVLITTDGPATITITQRWMESWGSLEAYEDAAMAALSPEHQAIVASAGGPALYVVNTMRTVDAGSEFTDALVAAAGVSR